MDRPPISAPPPTLAALLAEVREDAALAEAVRQARAADRAAVAETTPASGGATAGLPATRPLSRAAVDLIIAATVTNHATYERRYRAPVWHKGQPGIGIGIGYDLALSDPAGFRADWSSVLDEARLARLEAACGVTGLAAQALAASLTDLYVEWDEAEVVFRNRTLPALVGITGRALPGSDRLDGDCLAALVSLINARGTAFEGDRFREMRSIRQHVARGNLARIPAEIRSMRRLTQGQLGEAALRRRLEAEAALFEQGLAGGGEASDPAAAVETEGLLGGARDFVLGLFSEPTKDLVFATLERPGAPPAAMVVPDEAYVSVRVLSARITRSRRWTSNFHAAVHARADMIYEGATGRAEREVVLAPDGFRDIDPKGQGQLLQMDRLLFGPMPYRGDFRLSLALFSVKSADLAGPYLSLLGQIAETGALGFLSAAQPFLAPLRQATDLLFGTADAASLECGVVRGFDQLRTGTFACLGAARAQVPPTTRLGLDPTDLRLLWEDGQPVTEHAYVVFSIERSEMRDDWMSIPDLRDAWKALQTDMAAGGKETASLLDAFRRRCLASPDLLSADAVRLMQRARARFGAAQAVTEAVGFADLDLYAQRGC